MYAWLRKQIPTLGESPCLSLSSLLKIAFSCLTIQVSNIALFIGPVKHCFVIDCCALIGDACQQLGRILTLVETAFSLISRAWMQSYVIPTACDQQALDPISYCTPTYHAFIGSDVVLQSTIFAITDVVNDHRHPSQLPCNISWYGELASRNGCG